MVNSDLSLAGGAIRGWDRKTTYYFQMIQSLATHLQFDIETPFDELSEKSAEHRSLRQRQGERSSSSTPIPAACRSGKSIASRASFPNLERRYRETESNAVREELTRFLNSQPCPDCEGHAPESRRKKRVHHRAVHSGDHVDVRRRGARVFRGLKLDGWRATIADKIVKEIGDRLGFLSDVGLDYLSLSRSAETLSGGEAQRIRSGQPDRFGPRRRHVHSRRAIDRAASARQ